MKHLILTVSLITATYSAQAVEQKYFSTHNECEDTRYSVSAAGGQMFGAYYRFDPNVLIYKEKIVSFRCGLYQSRPHALLETRNEWQDRTNREELERNAKLKAEKELQQKKADLLIGIQ